MRLDLLYMGKRYQTDNVSSVAGGARAVLEKREGTRPDRREVSSRIGKA